MKLLKQFESEIDAKHLSDRLKGKGVFTFISSSRSHSSGRFATGALKVGFWAVLEDQHEDAVSLLTNKKHIVKQPLKIDEMVQLEKEAAHRMQIGINNKFQKLLTWGLIGSIFVFALAVLVSIVSTL